MWTSKKLNKFKEITHGFSDLSNGNLSFKRSKHGTLNNRKKFFKKLKIDLNTIVGMEMLHGTTIKKVAKSDSGKGVVSQQSAILKTDGLYTNKPNLTLFGTFADCLPIFAYDPNSQYICLVHAGWRGVADNIIEPLSSTLKTEGVKRKNCIVAVGPHIQKCCFEVGDEVLNKFPQQFIQGSFVDLKNYILSQLLKESFNKNNIELSNVCTLHSKKYFSHRKKGNKGANGAFISRI